jgi:hypothetical protein
MERTTQLPNRIGFLGLAWFLTRRVIVGVSVWIGVLVSCSHADPLRIGTFEVDVTPPLGSPVAYALTRHIDDPISARGIVLLGAGEPIVLCAVDYLGIANSGFQIWRETLARAAQTQPDRVAVHTLHQHDGPRCDFAVEELLAHHGLGGKRFDVNYLKDVLTRVEQAVRAAAANSQPLTHLGLGKGRVERVASNRRILGPDGKVQIVRWSRTTDPAAIEAPEGVIDPDLRMVSFWNESQPVAALTYYATHPQSYYGQGDVTCEFVGIARNQQQQRHGGLPHIHFNGAGGNITAGKYNDGSPENRLTLARRLEAGMEQAWQATRRTPISANDVTWRTVAVALPVAEDLDAERLREVLNDPQADDKQKLMAAKNLIWLLRCQAGEKIELSCLELGDASLLHMPGELFVEYQLAAQAAAPERFVAMAAYGDYAPGYIGTAASYEQGGYEVGPGVSRVAPQVEALLLEGIRGLLWQSDPNR